MMCRNIQGEMTKHRKRSTLQKQSGEKLGQLERRRLLIIHGVGDFNAETITAEVQTLAGKYGIAPSDVSAFNWDREVGGPFKGFNMDLAILAELGGGLLNLANLGFLQTSRSYCGIPQWYLRLQNWLFACGQIAFSFFIFLLPYVVLNTHYKKGFLAVITVLSASVILGASFSLSLKGMIVSVRRLVVTILWPVFHFFAVPVGFGLIALVVLILSVRLFNTIEGPGNEFLYMLLYIAIRLGSVVAAFAVMWAVAKVANPLLKVLSDVARYIGIGEHRRKLQTLLTQRLQREVDECDRLVILAHSLGSVIAVDTMLRSPQVLAPLKQLDFVTMGSPLRRLFHGFFPEIYSSVDAINLDLRNNINRFGWVNIYRPLDFIGAHLSANPESTILEFNTHELFKNHTNYWSDPVVATLIVKGLDHVKRSEPDSSTITVANVSNWPNELCAESYAGFGIAGLWSQRCHIFMGVFLLWIVWQIFLMIAGLYKAGRQWFSTEMIRSQAHDDGWVSTVFLNLFVGGMCIAGLVVITRFAYKKIWREWLGAYSASLLGCIKEARESPLMRYTPPVQPLQSGSD
jgi:hypothetical protein